VLGRACAAPPPPPPPPPHAATQAPAQAVAPPADADASSEGRRLLHVCSLKSMCLAAPPFTRIDVFGDAGALWQRIGLREPGARFERARRSGEPGRLPGALPPPPPGAAPDPQSAADLSCGWGGRGGSCSATRGMATCAQLYSPLRRLSSKRKAPGSMSCVAQWPWGPQRPRRVACVRTFGGGVRRASASASSATAAVYTSWGLQGRGCIGRAPEAARRGLRQRPRSCGSGSGAGPATVPARLWACPGRWRKRPRAPGRKPLAAARCCAPGRAGCAARPATVKLRRDLRQRRSVPHARL
jgi:hypothetical protein